MAAKTPRRAMAAKTSKRKSREEKYMEILQPTTPAVDQYAGPSLEQPTPLEIIDTTTTSEADSKEFFINA
jgi:hypothetical protein